MSIEWSSATSSRVPSNSTSDFASANASASFRSDAMAIRRTTLEGSVAEAVSSHWPSRSRNRADREGARGHPAPRGLRSPHTGCSARRPDCRLGACAGRWPVRRSAHTRLSPRAMPSTPRGYHATFVQTVMAIRDSSNRTRASRWRSPGSSESMLCQGPSPPARRSTVPDWPTAHSAPSRSAIAFRSKPVPLSMRTHRPSSPRRRMMPRVLTA